ncbi:hypothetical protein HZC30_07035 [Candidatus Woesearchaeota archaeon]|nr:hypothetical protein [Candidatus Woesearchaeota archaeon]
MHKKRWLLALFTLLVIPFALADIGTTLSNVWLRILDFGSLSFLGISGGQGVIAFTRTLLGILVFCIFFAVITMFGRGGSGDAARAPASFFNRAQAIVIAAVMAIISAVFLPAEAILATGAGWATAIAFLLIGGPIVGIGYVLWNITDWVNDGTETRGTIFLKLMLCLMLVWVLSSMGHYVGGMGF